MLKFFSDNIIPVASPVKCSDSKALLNLQCRKPLTVSFKESTEIRVYNVKNTFNIVTNTNTDQAQDTNHGVAKGDLLKQSRGMKGEMNPVGPVVVNGAGFG